MCMRVCIRRTDPTPHVHPHAQMHTKHDLEKVLVQFDVQDTTEDEVNPEELE